MSVSQCYLRLASVWSGRRSGILALVGFLTAISLFGQQPQVPQSGALVPGKFTDVTAAFGVHFKHLVEPTSRKFAGVESPHPECEIRCSD